VYASGCRIAGVGCTGGIVKAIARGPYSAHAAAAGTYAGTEIAVIVFADFVIVGICVLTGACGRIAGINGAFISIITILRRPSDAHTTRADIIRGAGFGIVTERAIRLSGAVGSRFRRGNSRN